MFEASKRLDEEDDAKPSVAVLFGGAKKKPSYNPSAKLDDEDASMGGDDPEARFTEACDIMAKMINAGRVDSEKLGQCLRKAFEALEEEPHEEGEHTNEEEG